MNLHRDDIQQLKSLGYHINEPWQAVDQFEKLIAEFFGSKFAVATDCSTHAIELCLRVLNNRRLVVSVPKQTYMSIPMMLEKIGQTWKFVDQLWKDFYYLEPSNIIDASTLWRQNSYQPGTLTCLSFQYKKHLPIGRGGMILLDDFELYSRLQKLVRDGRTRELSQFNDDVQEIGYHYFMTPEDAALGIKLFHMVKDVEPKSWSSNDYFDLTKLTVFKGR
jgi:dTDP-4-amino-4,6-dideoxygalactose transaminase